MAVVTYKYNLLLFVVTSAVVSVVSHNNKNTTNTSHSRSRRTAPTSPPMVVIMVVTTTVRTVSKWTGSCYLRRCRRRSRTNERTTPSNSKARARATVEPGRPVELLAQAQPPCVLFAALDSRCDAKRNETKRNGIRSQRWYYDGNIYLEYIMCYG